MPVMSKEMWITGAAAVVLATGMGIAACVIAGDDESTPKTATKGKKKRVKKSDESKVPASPANAQDKESAKVEPVELTQEQQQEEEQHLDMEAAIEETLKQVLGEKPDVIAEYTDKLKVRDALRKAGNPKEEIDQATNAAAVFFQGLLAPSPPEVQAAVMQKVQEHFGVRQQSRATARAQEEKSRKLEQETKEHWKRVLTEASGKFAELEPIFDRLQAAKKAGEKIKARQAKKDIKALVVNAVGEEAFTAVQKATRVARIKTLKAMIDEQLDEKIVNNDILRIQKLLELSPKDVKAKITEWAQKMNMEELMAAVASIMTPELQATLDTAVATVLEQSKIQNYEKSGESLTKSFTIDVNDEVFTMEQNKDMDEREEAIEGAGTEGGKEACRLQLKNFKESFPNELKEAKRTLLDTIYLEVEEFLPGVSVQQPDEDANAIRGARGDMRKLMVELEQAKAILLAAHTRITKSEAVLDKLPKASKEKHNKTYPAALKEVEDADTKLQEIRAWAAAEAESSPAADNQKVVVPLIGAGSAPPPPQVHTTQEMLVDQPIQAEEATQKATEEEQEDKKEASRDFMAEKTARKAAAMPDVDPDIDLAAMRAKARAGASMSQEEKKERGLLYDTSIASAVRDDSEDDIDDDECDFGGDPFEGM